MSRERDLMTDREPTILRKLLQRLLTARARRNREDRFSKPWHAADVELHEIERAIFRLPAEPAPAPHRGAGAPSRAAGAPAARPNRPRLARTLPEGR